MIVVMIVVMIVRCSQLSALSSHRSGLLTRGRTHARGHGRTHIAVLSWIDGVECVESIEGKE